MLQTTTGEPVEVIDAGLPNTNAGPDFFNAKLKIGGTLWVGNIEVHTLASDWMRHGHDKDAAYDNVILYVAETVDCEVFRANGAPVPQLQLSCPESVRQRYDELSHAEIYPPCYSILSSETNSPFLAFCFAGRTFRAESPCDCRPVGAMQ